MTSILKGTPEAAGDLNTPFISDQFVESAEAGLGVLACIYNTASPLGDADSGSIDDSGPVGEFNPSELRANDIFDLN